MFTTHPVTVLRADGSVGLDEKAEKMGEISIPAEGKYGTWCVKGRPRGGPPIPFCPHIRLINVPPIVASAPERLLRAPLKPTSEAPTWSPPTGDFADGIVGKAIHLANGRTLKFPRGEKLADGSYQHFPAREGTIELWFRPDWSTAWLPVKDGERINRSFVRGLSIDFYYRYGFGPWRNNFYAFLDLLTKGALGRPDEGKRGEIGGQTRYFFKAGEWCHLAAVWKISEGKRGTEGDFAVFINGRRQPRMWEYPFPLTGRDRYVLKEAVSSITIGCPEGCVDEMRISKLARYKEDFAPSKQSFITDAYTAALFHFDGDANGLSGASGEPVEAR